MKPKYLFKKSIQSFFLVSSLFFSVISYGQKNAKNSFSNEYIKNCIREVCQDKADELVFKSDSDRYARITNFFNRFSIENNPALASKKGYPKLSSLPLNNKMNKNLSREVVFNSSTFNPLKYRFGAPSDKTKVYQVDNTNYVLIITPQNNY